LNSIKSIPFILQYVHIIFHGNILLYPNFDTMNKGSRFFGGCFTLLLLLFSCHTPTVVSEKNISIQNTLTPDSATQMWLSTFTDSVNKTMDSVIAYTDTSLDKIRYATRISQQQETDANLARVCSDYVFYSANAWLKSNLKRRCDMVVLNHNGFRNNIPKGPITIGSVFEVMPFDNEIVILKLTGSQMDSLFLFIAKLGGSPVANLRLEITETSYNKALIGNTRFDSRRDYYVATNDFMYKGGDNFTMLKFPEEVYNTNILIRDAILEGFKSEFLETKHIQAKPNPRIIHVKTP